MGADTRKKIYDILKNKTGFRDSYEDFSSDISNSEDARKKVFEVLRDRTGFTDSYDNFVKGISDSEPVEEVNQVTTVQAPSYTQKPETREGYSTTYLTTSRAVVMTYQPFRFLRTL